MTQNKRRRTINSRGEIVDAPCGPSRWASPRTYTCAHQGCPHPATVLKTADETHPTVTKVHNCCGHH